MSTYSLLVVTATPNPNEMASVQEYLQGVMPLFAQAGAELVSRSKVSEVLKGSSVEMVLVMKLESDDAIKTLFNLPEYQALVPVRDKGFKEINIMISHEL